MKKILYWAAAIVLVSGTVWYFFADKIKASYKAMTSK